MRAFLEFLTRGLGARSPGGLGPGPPGLGGRPPGAWGLFPTKTKTSQITIFRKPPGGSLAKAWVSVKRLLRRWGPGGKRSRDTPPTPPPQPHPAYLGGIKKGRGFSPSPPSATIQHAPQIRRGFETRPHGFEAPALRGLRFGSSSNNCALNKKLANTVRSKSIGATSQAFHEGIFGILEAARLPGCRAQGLVGQVPKGLAAAAAEMARFSGGLGPGPPGLGGRPRLGQPSNTPPKVGGCPLTPQILNPKP